MTASPSPEDSQPRSMCYRCHKAAVVCICDSVQKVQNRTPITVLQHPRERFHAIGTARIARLGLANVSVESCTPWDRSSLAGEQIPRGAALLYPGPTARSLDTVAPPRALVVIDGTWFHAKKIYDAFGVLRSLPAVTLPARESQYRIRREPRRGYLSTIEAIVSALRIVEPETKGLDGLLDAFAGMIDRQIEYWPRNSLRS